MKIKSKIPIVSLFILNPETAPLVENVSKEGDAALKRLGDVHDIHVPLCGALLSEFSGIEVCLLARDHAAVHSRQRRVHHRESRKSRGHEGDEPRCSGKCSKDLPRYLAAKARRQGKGS